MKKKNRFWIYQLVMMGFLTTSCKKGDDLPVLTTSVVSDITQTTATSGGNITSDGRAIVIARGVCWSYTNTKPNVTDSNTRDGKGTGNFISHMTGLIANTQYNIRAYAITNTDTIYDTYSQVFLTLQDYTAPIVFNPNKTYGSVSDIDGNIYKTIQIGTQVWMAENLKTTKYNDGRDIPLDTVWESTTSPAYCWLNNLPANYKATYGALYNWYTVSTGMLCPTGWHVSKDTEWSTLTDFLGGVNSAPQLLETGISHWLNSNPYATNESGFTALPGGYRYSEGFIGFPYNGYWWCYEDLLRVYSRDMSYAHKSVFGYAGFEDSQRLKSYGYSVRCIKD